LSADLDDGIVRPELDTLHVVKVMSWRFAEHGVTSTSIYPVFHVKNYRAEARILDDFGPHTLQKRTLKSGRKKKERKSNADPRCESLEPILEIARMVNPLCLASVSRQ